VWRKFYIKGGLVDEKGCSLLVLLLALSGGIYLAYSISLSGTNELLFNAVPWLIPLVLFLGVFVGATVGRERTQNY
jgi:hypothetical protein